MNDLFVLGTPEVLVGLKVSASRYHPHIVRGQFATRYNRLALGRSRRGRLIE
jgi:hypothetical protein